MASSTTVPRSPDLGAEPEKMIPPAALQGSSAEQSIALGQASSKPWVDYRDVIALLVTFGCFVAAVLTVTPSMHISWRLGDKWQIIVIGLLLGVQNLCLQRVVSNSFVLLEARLGKSIIQNYNAILRNQSMGSHTHPAWRAALITLSILPLALSIAYKRYLGGTSLAPIRNKFFTNFSYGLAYPDLGPYASMSNSIYLSMNANSGFLNASRNDQKQPFGAGFSYVYSYNTLVINEDSAALLDMPLVPYIREIQETLIKNETWEVSAFVDAIVATRNQSIASLRQDKDFLNQTMHYASNGFASQILFDSGLGFGWMSVGVPQVGDAYCLMGTFGNKSAVAPGPIGLTRNTSDKGFLDFMESAQMFSIRRQGCHGTWAISQSEVKLSDGHCPDKSAAGHTPSSRVLHHGLTSPFALDVLPVLVNSIGVYSTIRPSSPWKQVSYLVAAANTWWARSAYLNYGEPTFAKPDERWVFQTFPETIYHPRNQNISSTRPTLDAHWGLYLVLAVLPFITFLLYLPLLLLYSLPVGTGFGLVSILASIDRHSLDLIQGAGLSGELKGPIRLGLSSEEVPNNKGEANAEAKHRIRYVLSEESERRIETVIERGQTYE